MQSTNSFETSNLNHIVKNRKKIIKMRKVKAGFELPEQRTSRRPRIQSDSPPEVDLVEFNNEATNNLNLYSNFSNSSLPLLI
jgi:hypothetical protein